MVHFCQKVIFVVDMPGPKHSRLLFFNTSLIASTVIRSVIFKFSLLDKSSSKSSIAFVMFDIKRTFLNVHLWSFGKLKLIMECQRCSIWFCHPAVQLKPVRCQIFCKIWIQTHAKVEKRCLFQDIHMAASSNMCNICTSKSHIDQIVSLKLRWSLFPLWQYELLTAFNMLWNNFKVVPLEIGKANVENIWYVVHQSLHFYCFWLESLIISVNPFGL